MCDDVKDIMLTWKVNKLMAAEDQTSGMLISLPPGIEYCTYNKNYSKSVYSFYFNANYCRICPSDWVISNIN